MKKRRRRLFPVRLKSENPNEFDQIPLSSPPIDDTSDSRFLNENAQLRSELEKNRFSYEQAVIDVRAQIHSVDQEWETQRVVHSQKLQRLKERIETESQTIQALENARKMNTLNAPTNENEDLSAQKAELEQELAMAADSCAKLEKAVGFVERETEAFKWLMMVFPFPDQGLHELVIRQIAFRIGKELYEYERRAMELEQDLEVLKDDVRLVRTVARGLRLENESLRTRIAGAREFEEEVVGIFHRITEDAERGKGGVSEADLAILIEENQRKTKRALAQINLEFDTRFRALAPSPQYLMDEIAVKESATEVMNAKIRELFSELEKMAANREMMRKRITEKQQRELDDILARAELKKQDLLSQQRHVLSAH
jgi:regulator of replication initiation timing